MWSGILTFLTFLFGAILLASSPYQKGLGPGPNPWQWHTPTLVMGGLTGDLGTYLVRSLLSEGRLRYVTVEKTKDGLKPRLIEREGPTGLLVTTTEVSLHPENETRLLSIYVTDTPEQTARVLLALARGERPTFDFGAWHALQAWLETGERRVAVPFAEALARSIQPVAVRLRRDFGAILGLIRAHALLHQASRLQDGQGRILATIEDYVVVRGLVADLLAEGIGAGVSQTVRETVEAVRALGAIRDDRAVPVVQVARRLRIDKSAASRRVAAAVERGYLRNLEDKPGKPSRIVIGDGMPEDSPILPGPEALAAEGCTVAAMNRGTDSPPRAPPVPVPDPEPTPRATTAQQPQSAECGHASTWDGWTDYGCEPCHERMLAERAADEASEREAIQGEGEPS